MVYYGEVDDIGELLKYIGKKPSHVVVEGEDSNVKLLVFDETGETEVDMEIRNGRGRIKSMFAGEYFKDMLKAGIGECYVRGGVDAPLVVRENGSVKSMYVIAPRIEKSG